MIKILLILSHLIFYSIGELTHSSVKLGFFSPQKLSEVISRNQLSIPVKVTVVDQRFNITEDHTILRRAGTCNFDTDCSSQYCCPNVLGETAGQCYDTSTKCCALDGNILPASIVATMTLQGECCSYSAQTNTYTSCPPNAENSQYSKCGANGTCVKTCDENTDCPAGSSCCKAPSSTDPSAGHRCYGSTEICCFDGRVCTAETCSDLPSDGQCCGIDASNGQFSYCGANTYCNAVDGALKCTSYQYGQDPSSTTYVVPLNFDKGNGDSSNNSHLGLIVGIAVPVAIIIAAIVVAISILVYRRNKKRQNIGKVVEPTVPPHYSESALVEGPSSESMKYQRLSINAMKPSYATMQTGAGATTTPPAYTQVVRNDGGVYAAMEATTTANDKNRGIHSAIEWSEIEMIESIGRGSFGEAYRAKWHEAAVAVKKIHPDLFGNEEAIHNFYGETEILKTLKPHPNTVLFFGVTKEPIAILMEYCENGSLRQYLNTPTVISINMKRNFLLGIARGMLHLHFYNIIHRDLAARNILLTSNLDVKVSDFGFSRELEGPDANRIKTPVGPVNWFPPEALKEHSFSTKTDVWSFGVVIWEVLTRNEPFADKSSAEVIVGVIQNGLTVEVPDDCPPVFANLMRMCFQQNPTDRPTFKEICTILESEPINTVTA